MGKQYNKIEKRNRRKAREKRKKQLASSSGKKN
jgi:hypothetical protein